MSPSDASLRVSVCVCVCVCSSFLRGLFPQNVEKNPCREAVAATTATPPPDPMFLVYFGKLIPPVWIQSAPIWVSKNTERAMSEPPAASFPRDSSWNPEEARAPGEME